MPSLSRRLLPALAALVVAASAARGQVMSGQGYLLGRPGATLSIHTGLDMPAGGGDLLDFVTKQLTLDKGSFRAPSLRLDLGVELTPRTELTLGLLVAGTNTGSEYRNFVDNAGLPIEQRTRFTRTAVTASYKVYLAPRGRSIGQYVWIPARVTPYVGIGGGMVYHEFTQEGDFVDFQTNNVFTTQLESNGWSGTAHALAGADITLTPRYALLLEARYTRASSGLGNGFATFNRLDLSGLTTTVGIGVRF